MVARLADELIDSWFDVVMEKAGHCSDLSCVSHFRGLVASNMALLSIGSSAWSGDAMTKGDQARLTAWSASASGSSPSGTTIGVLRRSGWT